MSNRPTSNRRGLALLLTAAILTLAACAGGSATPSPTPAPVPIGTAAPTPTAVPGDPGAGSGGSGGGVTDPGTGSGGGSGGNVGGIFPGDPSQNPLFGQATYLTPGKDLQGQHPVNVQLVRALQRDDATVVADLRWWSGVAPCTQLDHVEIAKDDGARTIKLTVIEGSGKGDMACIDIAQLSATTVDLGTLAAGDWKLSVDGDAPTITLEVK
jgi:hypothetical protein